MLTVHLIFNAHIDPVYLWGWPAGADEVLATCRSACDRLEANPDLIFTRGEAWAYRLVQELNPPLFARIRKHIEAGRWEIVGGWWIQPDCNQPSGWAMQKQIELGQRYFQKTFGHSPLVAYNVDSFGHAATLPGYIHQAGQRYYVMMRPQEHEMTLPARLFRWRGYPGTPEIVTFRIAVGYGTGNENLSAPELVSRVRAAATQLPEGIAHTMLFMGVGDHGGGPTERLIALCREHMTAIDGVRLVFSSPRRFFDAVAPQIDRLPLVTGELQMHAIGCYSVHRGVKTALRRAEHLLLQAQTALEVAPPSKSMPLDLEPAWQRVAFNHFHDTLGGTCIPSAYPQMEAQLGQALALADDAVHLALRRKIQSFPNDIHQRAILLNASDRPFDGYTEFDPWLGGWGAWTPEHRLLDEADRNVECQALAGEAIVPGPPPRVLCRLRVEPGQLRVLRIMAPGHSAADRAAKPAELPTAPAGLTILPEALSQRESQGLGTGVDWGRRQLSLAGLTLPLPRLALLEDPTDTWSHGVDRYVEGTVTSAHWDDPVVLESGPLRTAMIQTGCIGTSPLRWEWRLYAGEPYVELVLRVEWRQQRQVLKLILSAPTPFEGRVDGIMGGELERPNNGREVPCRDFTLLRCGDGRQLGIVCPDVYALDASAHRLRLTLLRSPLMACHIPHPGAAPRGQYSDRGEHVFRFRFLAGPGATPQALDNQALMLQRPLIYAALTKGMPSCGTTG